MKLDRIEAVANNVTLLINACKEQGIELAMTTFNSVVLAEGVIKGLTIQTTVSEMGLATWSCDEIDFTCPTFCAQYIKRCLRILDTVDALKMKGLTNVKAYFALGCVKFDGTSASIKASVTTENGEPVFFVRGVMFETIDEALDHLQKYCNLEIITDKQANAMERATGVMKSVSGEWDGNVFTKDNSTLTVVGCDDQFVVRLGCFEFETHSLLLARCLFQNGDALAAIPEDGITLELCGEAISHFYEGYGNWQAIAEVAYKVCEKVDGFKMFHKQGESLCIHDSESNVLALSHNHNHYLQSMNTMTKEEQDKEMNELDEFVNNLKWGN